jgi:hypothetical protein
VGDPKVRRIAACCLFLLLGSPHSTLSPSNLADPGHIAAHRDRGEITLWGRVVAEPDIRDTTNLRLALVRVRIDAEQHQVVAKSWCEPRVTRHTCTTTNLRLWREKRRNPSINSSRSVICLVSGSSLVVRQSRVRCTLGPKRKRPSSSEGPQPTRSRALSARAIYLL